ncbi:MAG: mechanosensitive ion channel family protein [Gammaproteobacteria bacterium]|nr:mechanosensitive ion channel family protein [Gammaproteobacteria bacterium]
MIDRETLLELVNFTDLLQASLRVAVVLLLWWLLTRALKVFLGRLGARLLARAESADENPVEARKRIETLVHLLTQMIRIVLFVTLALVLLMQLGVQVGPLIASAGIIGLAVGFGAQSLVKDVITGFFMVMENQMRVGDVVTINGTGGLVEMMTLRTVVLRDLGGVVHIFPNGSINTVSNATRGWSACLFDIRIGLRADPDQAIAVLGEIGNALQADPVYGPKILAAAEIFGVERIEDSALVIRGRIKTHPIMQWEVGRELLRRVHRQFAAHGIEIPFPQRQLHLSRNALADPRLAALAGLAQPNAATAAQARKDAG